MPFIRSALIALTLAGAATLAGGTTAFAQPAHHHHMRPHSEMRGGPFGPPRTGDGATSTAAGGPFTAGGIALIGAGGLAAGAAAVRRRRSGSPS